MARRKSPKQRKEERQQEKRRGQQTLIIGAVVLVAIFAAIIFALTSLPAEAPIPADIDKFDRFLQSTTDEGYPLLGNPDAPVEVREYASFSCVGCLDFHGSVFPGLLDDVAEGRINLVYVPLQTGSVPNPEGAARTAICAGAQGKFWQMHDVLFSWHETYVNSAFQDGRIRTGVQELGLNRSEFNSCFNNNTTSAILSSAQGEGVTSTPTVTVNGAPVAANLAAIEEAIRNNTGGQSSFAPGVVDDADAEALDDTEADATEEPMEEEDAEAVDDAEGEATEEAMEEEADTSEEETEDEGEATEEAMDEAEATEEADE